MVEPRDKPPNQHQVIRSLTLCSRVVAIISLSFVVRVENMGISDWHLVFRNRPVHFPPSASRRHRETLPSTINSRRSLAPKDPEDPWISSPHRFSHIQLSYRSCPSIVVYIPYLRSRVYLVSCLFVSLRQGSCCSSAKVPGNGAPPPITVCTKAKGTGGFPASMLPYHNILDFLTAAQVPAQI